MSEPKKDGSSSRPRASPCSPFPFGSPLQQGLDQSSFCGSPGQRLLLDSFPTSSSKSRRSPAEVVTPRLKGQDMYGGTVMFGGGSSFRRHRMLSASPYSAALRNRQTERLSRACPPSALSNVPSSLPSTAPSSPSPVPTPDSLSSTARIILDTLDKMSTPIQDAKKIPTLIQPRAEKRKLIEESLQCSLKSPQRRRVRLGSNALSLGGPPLRKNYSPVPVTRLERPLSNGFSSHSNEVPIVASTTPVCPPLPKTTPADLKSTFKLKAKVAASASRKAPDMSSTCPPPSPPGFLAQAGSLPCTTMPVFSLAPPTPVTNGGLGGLHKEGTDESEEEIIENNNNKKKRSLEEVSSSSPNKKTTGMVFPRTSTTPILPLTSNDTTTITTTKPSITKINNSSTFNPSKSSIINTFTETVVNKTNLVPKEDINRAIKESSVATPIPAFTFSSPKIVISQETGVETSGIHYTFSLPVAVLSDQEKNESASGYPALKTVSTQGEKSLVSTNFSMPSSPPKVMFSTMPDVTNNLIRKFPVTESLKGGNSSSRLPDLTASTGFGGFEPAKQLKMGSVMDVLGKRA